MTGEKRRQSRTGEEPVLADLSAAERAIPAEWRGMVGESDSEFAGLSSPALSEGSDEEEHGRDDGTNGAVRTLQPEIEAGYASDSSTEETANTIGNVNLDLYREFPHIGYDINGKRIMRPAAGRALDRLLESVELPAGWTGLVDKNTGQDLTLTPEELEIVRKIQMAVVPDDSIDPYAPMVPWFSSQTMVTPLSSAPEPKRRFAPSKHEAKRVMKIVKAIREGRIVPRKTTDPESEVPRLHDIWIDQPSDYKPHIMNIPAPKLPLPSTYESYNPPEEYLPTEEEIAEFENNPDQRERDFLSRNYPSLRVVPVWKDALKERFERCLDLYLAPRIRRNKLNIDPDSLIPKLPNPRDLRPFPSHRTIIYGSCEGKVRTVSIDPSGLWLCSGGDDGAIRIWEIMTGREVWKWVTPKNEAVEACEWSPNKNVGILAVAAGESMYILLPSIWLETKTKESIKFCATASEGNSVTNKAHGLPARWSECKHDASNLCLTVACKSPIKQVAFHRQGSYIVTVSPRGSAAQSVIVHHLSSRTSQSPFAKSKGEIQRVQFHPHKPYLFVATQRYIKVYNLTSQTLIKILQSGVRWISSLSVHPQGENVIFGSYDRKFGWFDLELSSKPYKILRHHTMAVRSVQFHRHLPLFATASDDGIIGVFHGGVDNTGLGNAMIVPLKMLQRGGHTVKNSLGVLAIAWHPQHPFLVSAGADGQIILWT